MCILLANKNEVMEKIKLQLRYWPLLYFTLILDYRNVYIVEKFSLLYSS